MDVPEHARLSCSLACFKIIFNAYQRKEGLVMKNPLDSIGGTIVSGLILTVILVAFLKNFILAGV
jgi:hypothetical protein